MNTICTDGLRMPQSYASIMLQRLIGPNRTRRGSTHHRNHYLLIMLSRDGLLAKHSDFTLPLFIQLLACSALRRITHSRVDYTHFARTIDPRPTALEKRKNTISSTSSSPQQRILSGCKVKRKMREELR